MGDFKLLVCTNIRYNPKHSSCAGKGSEVLLKQLKQLAQEGQEPPIQIEEIKCFGQCDKAPVMRIAPAKEFFYCVTEDDLKDVLTTVQELNKI